MIPSEILVMPGMNASYVTVLAEPDASAPTTASEMATLNASAPKGFTVRLGSNVVNVTSLPAPPKVSVAITAEGSLKPGNYTFTIQARSGNASGASTLTVRVVQYLVLMQNFAFTPTKMTVPAGATVYWFNADPPHNWCGNVDSGDKSVVFIRGMSDSSPTIHSFMWWRHVFSGGGSFVYADDMHYSNGNATITVSG